MKLNFSVTIETGEKQGEQAAKMLRDAISPLSAGIANTTFTVKGAVETAPETVVEPEPEAEALPKPNRKKRK